jgi:large subunit ribosomal protein L25
MESVELKASRREGTGKQVTRKLRATGAIPAVLYGSGAEPQSLQIDKVELDRIFREHAGGNFILNLEVEKEKPVMTIIRETQRHPVSGQLVHLDFQRVSTDKPIAVQVPVRLVGESPGVKDFGGVLEFVLRELEVSCLPLEIPDEVVVDISEMLLNDSIHVADLDLPNIEFITETERTIVSVSMPRIQKSAAEIEAEEAEEAEAAEAAEAAEGEGEAAEGSGEGGDADKDAS